MDMMLGFLGTYITAAEIGTKTPTLTISRVTLEKVESLKASDNEGDGKTKDRVIVYFRESKSDRGWLLNRTNAECLREMWGRETDQWIGKRVTLYSCPVRVGPKMEPGIRVKGSPDISTPITFQLKLPRKKPIPTTLVPTGKSKDAPPPKSGHDSGPPPTTADELIARMRSATSTDELYELGNLIEAIPDEHHRSGSSAVFNQRLKELA